MIKIENLRFSYFDREEVLKGINLEIYEGEFIAIMGENGAGKTTLIKHFNGLLKPTSGKVLVDEIDTRKTSVASLAKLVGLVFQNPDHQLFCETVWDEVAFSLKNFNYKDDVIKARVKKILEILDLTRYSASSPFTLSGGERKRVALASVLVWDPKYIVLDEPTIGQDYRQKERLRNFILQLVTQGKTVVMVTHDVEFVAEGHPRVILLSKGRIVADGSAEEILSNEKFVNECSLELPQISKLMKELKNLDVNQKIIDVYSAKAYLTKILKGGKSLVA
ncbi:ABC transporter ATP-binding protein [Candidatus Bathyarchaeota archaeon]|nr:ABC transporter ATP-binding protein [Candidatus Bathyarchaeota archaeon]